VLEKGGDDNIRFIILSFIMFAIKSFLFFTRTYSHAFSYEGIYIIVLSHLFTTTVVCAYQIITAN